MEILTSVRTAYHHDDKVSVGVDDLIPYRWFQQMAMVFDPLFEINRRNHFISGRERFESYRGIQVWLKHAACGEPCQSHVR